MSNHLHFMIWAADGRSDAGYVGVTYIDLIASSVSDAMDRAKMIVPNRTFYWLNNVTEHHAHRDKGE